MAGKKSKSACAKTMSQGVAALAAEHGLDQVVVLGWRAKDERYVMVAHGRNKLEQMDADNFAAKLMEGIGLPEGQLVRVK